tara:strand:- start:106331 stop:107812 length:1482 start_codon:yes stop_codon:yes gene_type:complete
MKQLKYRILIVALVLSASLQAQKENIFLDRTFWDTKPSIETVDAKITAGNDIAQLNSNSFDPVVYAILQNAPNTSIEYILSKEGNDVNKLTHDGRTYIFWAAYKGNLTIVHYLLNNGAKTDIKDDKGSTILNFAASSGQQNTKIYDLLIANGANLQEDLNPKGANALLLAAPADPNFNLINYFISKGLSLNSVDADGNGVFNYVAKTGNIAFMNALIKKGVKGNDNAMIFASQGTRNAQNGLAVFTYLESLGMNPNVVSKDGITPLHAIASGSNDLSLFDYFLKKGADVNQTDSNGNTVFMNAASRNNLEVLSLLAITVQDINAVNKKGISPLALAVQNNSAEIVQFLISKKANVGVLDKNGNNLIYYLMNGYSSKKSEDFEAKLKLLQANGLVATTPQKNGNTLYHLALDKDDLDLLKRVGQFDIDVNAKNKEGITPLHKAAMRAKDAVILKYLVSIGAKKDALTDFDESAYDLAAENELLKQGKTAIEFLK